MPDVYQTENGWQVDTAAGSFVFAPSRFSAGSVELLEVYPAAAKAFASAALAEGRAAGLPL